MPKSVCTGAGLLCNIRLQDTRQVILLPPRISSRTIRDGITHCVVGQTRGIGLRKVPDHCKYRLASLLSPRELLGRVFLGFTLDGTALIAYRREVMADSSTTYWLEWWHFNYHQRLVMIGETPLFRKRDITHHPININLNHGTSTSSSNSTSASPSSSAYNDRFNDSHLVQQMMLFYRSIMLLHSFPHAIL